MALLRLPTVLMAMDQVIVMMLDDTVVVVGGGIVQYDVVLDDVVVDDCVICIGILKLWNLGKCRDGGRG